MTRFRILCERSGRSQFGAATSYMKDVAGRAIEFDTREEADARLAKYNALSVRNVTYSVAEIES